MRTLIAGALALSTLGLAPMQCRRDPDPNLRIEDTAGDALWDLAQDFKKKGNVDAERQTLRFLVDRYPSNRHAAEARAAIGDAPPAAEPKARDGGS